MPTTTSRSDFARQAVACFNRQTWPNKELIIDDDDTMLLGLKLNRACQHARGEYIARWDDDDVSGPERLAVQYKALRATGKAVTAFRQIPFKQGDDWYLSPAAATAECSGLGIGSSLFFTKVWSNSHSWHATSLGEDTLFARAADAEGQLHLVDDWTQMYAVRHAANTWRFRLPLPGWTPLPDFEGMLRNFNALVWLPQSTL
jgi:hypothetical protein